MNPLHVDMKKGIFLGALAGIAWGLIAMAVNKLTGVFPYESSFAHNAVSFALGGMLFGVFAGAVMAVIGRLLPAWNSVVKAVILSAAAWVVLRAIGAFLSKMDHHRYHLNPTEALQGLLLAALMGLFIGLMWKRGEPRRA